MRRESISSELLICGGGVYSILLLRLVTRLYGACRFYVCCSDCVDACGNVCCVAAVGKDSYFWLVVFLFIL